MGFVLVEYDSGHQEGTAHSFLFSLLMNYISEGLIRKTENALSM